MFDSWLRTSVEISPILEAPMHAKACDPRATLARRRACLSQAVEGQTHRLGPVLAAAQLEVVVVPVATVVAAARDLDTGHAYAIRADCSLRHSVVRITREAHPQLCNRGVIVSSQDQIGRAIAKGSEFLAYPRLPCGTAARLEVVEVAIALLEACVSYLESRDLGVGCAAHLLALAVPRALLSAPCCPGHDPHEEATDTRFLLTIVTEVQSEPV